ncbi:MAG: V-type ATP synthase subunit E family protein [Oscillospiraceae bacterium]
MGAKQILDAIMIEARSDSEQITQNAQNTVAETRERTVADADARAAKIEIRAKADAEEIERRRMLTAGIEARKNTLAARRSLIEQAFSAALVRLCALDGEPYTELVTKLALEASATGDEKLVVPLDVRERFEKPYCGKTSVLDTLNNELKKIGKKGALSLDTQSGNFAGGFKLVGEFSDVDCSFTPLVSAWRDEHETEVSSLLFGAEG